MMEGEKKPKTTMERYTVTVAPPGAESLRLLIPYPPTSSVSALAAEVKRRASRLDVWPDVPELALRLGDVDGSLLDEDDLLADVILDPKVETITAISRIKKVASIPPPVAQRPHVPVVSNAQDLRLRIITPALARTHKDVRTIPILGDATITRKTTLRGIRTHIYNHLGMPVSDLIQTSQECNCSFARQIDERALRNESHSREAANDTPTHPSSVIIVHGKNQVRILKTEAVDQPSLLETVRHDLGGDVVSKKISFIGGTLVPNTTNQYSKVPVLSVCSMERHEKSARRRSGGDDPSESAWYDLDLHTSESPIEASILNLDLTIDELCLTDCAINGVLNIYVVERKASPASNQGESGKDAIFLTGDPWMHPIPQSKRGMAMLLSSLRVFTGLIGAKHMEASAQDAVLHVFNVLTRFPPAVRAVHILMNGKSPRPSERAALAQAIYEVLKDIVPLQLVKSDTGRILEGARLLLGLILEKAKHLKLKEGVQMPYISSLKVLDLRNTFTMEPMLNPIQTPFGLVDEGYYEAFKEGGILYWKTEEQPLSALPLDERTKRISLLCGGLIPQIIIFDLNNLNAGSDYADKGDVDKLILSRELSDLNHLSALCSRNNLSVLPPSTLPSAEAPALTLDRGGLLAVYVGRAPCAQPGKDITIFRPTNGGEDNIDVAITTQLLVPILEQRESDGTSIFDAFGNGLQRKFKAPDEIIIVCVDCSNSMSEDSDFVEIKDDETSDGDDDSSMDESEIQAQASMDGSSFLCATLDEMKMSITEHESFDDMVIIVHDAPLSKRQEATSKVLGILSGLASKELSSRLLRLDELKTRVTMAYYRRQVTDCEADITKLKTFIAGLNAHKQGICDFLLYRAANSILLDEQLFWKIGDPIPQVPKKTSDVHSNALSEEEFAIPANYLCPISREVMNDPVLTCDGFTFERNAIERWFQIRQSSPLTGLDLENTDLRSNGQLANEVKLWIEGKELVHPASSPSSSATTSRTRTSNQMVTVRFFSRLGSFNRQISRTMSINVLYRLAFRGMKGRHVEFQLHSNNVFLAPSEDPISSTNIRSNSIIHINAPEASSAPSAPSAPSRSNGKDREVETVEYEELCLIKVYKQLDEVLFSYWIPKKTTKTFTTVIFKYWRYHLKHNTRSPYQNLVAWTDMTNQGDGHISGHPQDHWNQLSGFLNPRYANGKLKNEKMYPDSETTEEMSDEDVEMDEDNAARPLVLKIHVGSGPAKQKDRSGKNLSRLDILKSMFDAFVNRLLAYNFQTHMGLITFQSTARDSQYITHAVENFRHKLNNMKADGDTALWDALALANDQLSEYSRKFPTAKKRIICLSDGKDTKSKQRSSDVSWSLFQNNVVVDSFCLGDEQNTDLLTVSYLSGGYKFKPESLEQAMAICEMEPVLSQLERPTIAPPREALSHNYDPYLRFVFAKGKAIPETVTTDIFPQRKQHPNVNDRFVQLSMSTGDAPGGSSKGPLAAHSDSNLRESRILTEIRNIVANPHPHYDVYMSESNMSFWKVVIQGPPESAYSTGTFVLYLDMEEDYPAFPPKCRFTVPILHPNINKHGKVCHSILDRNWTSDTSNLQLLNTIYSLLLVPEFSDPVNAVVTLNFHWDEVAFREEVRKHIQKHATKTREAWKEELLTE